MTILLSWYATVPGAMRLLTDFYNGLHPDDRERTSEAFAASAVPR